jgi:hypothetical protein
MRKNKDKKESFTALKEHIFFSYTYATFVKTNCIFGNKENL